MAVNPGPSKPIYCRPPGKTGFLKMYCVKKNRESARLRDGKGGHSRDEDKTAASAANKADLNRTQVWAREVHLPSFFVQDPASRRSPEVDSAAQQLNPWTSYDPDALSLRVFLSMGSVCVVRSNLCRVKFPWTVPVQASRRLSVHAPEVCVT